MLPLGRELGHLEIEYIDFLLQQNYYMCWSDKEDEAYTLQLHESLGITTTCTEKT